MIGIVLMMLLTAFTIPFAQAQKVGGWTYHETKDEMRGTVNKYASTESINTVNFKFPYQGIQHATVMAIKGGVLFYVSKGQVVCNGGSKYGTCLVLVKFDDAKAKYVNAKKSGDDSTTIAITESNFLKKMKESKKLMIEVEVFHNGIPVFNFDVSGLNQK